MNQVKIREQLKNPLCTFTAHNVGSETNKKDQPGIKEKKAQKAKFLSFGNIDLVTDINVRHERLEHIFHEYIRLMVDAGMAKGVLIKRLGKLDCADFHCGKKQKKTFQKALGKEMARLNDIIFVHLLITGVKNASPYSSVLVVYSCYVKAFMFKSIM